MMEIQCVNNEILPLPLQVHGQLIGSKTRLELGEKIIEFCIRDRSRKMFSDTRYESPHILNVFHELFCAYTLSLSIDFFQHLSRVQLHTRGWIFIGSIGVKSSRMHVFWFTLEDKDLGWFPKNFKTQGISSRSQDVAIYVRVELFAGDFVSNDILAFYLIRVW